MVRAIDFTKMFLVERQMWRVFALIERLYRNSFLEYMKSLQHRKKPLRLRTVKLHECVAYFWVYRRTAWEDILYEKNLIAEKSFELNWSGRGQHVEFAADEQPTIESLLQPLGVLGHSATAIVVC